MKNARVAKMQAKWAFERVCKEKDWRYDSKGNHEAHVNSNKLSPFEIYEPSFLVDKEFDELSSSLFWVEVKSCNGSGVIRLPQKEFDIHSQMNLARPVFYALYVPKEKAFAKMVHINELQRVLKEPQDGYFTFSLDEV